MIAAFLFAGDLPVALASVMSASVRRWMPACEVVQLTDEETPALACADRCLRLDGGNLFDLRARHLAGLQGDVLSLDYDCLVQRSVEEIFRGPYQPFDIALTLRPVDSGASVPAYLSEAAPYQCGVIFQRNGQFWRDLLPAYQALPSPDWMAGELLVSSAAQRTALDVLELPGEIYNFTPAKEKDYLGAAAIVHFKGHRKPWMLAGCNPVDIELARLEGERVKKMVGRERLKAQLAQRVHV